jgi:hypothetical protein
MTRPDANRPAGEDATAPYEPVDDATTAYERVDDPDATRPLGAAGAAGAAGAGAADPDATQVGDAWTGRAEVRGAVPPEDATEQWAGEEPEPEEPGRRWWLPILMGLLGLLIIIGVIAAIVGLTRDDNPEPTPTLSPAAPTSAAASPSPASQSPSPAPSSAPPTATATVLVPDVTGNTEAVATGKLSALGLNVHVQTQEDPVATPGTVLASVPTAGSEVPSGSDITIIVAKAVPESPRPQPSPSHQQPEESLSPQAVAPS